MKEPALESLQQAFRNHGADAPPEYLWLLQHRTLGFDDFTQLEPWQFCDLPEIIPLAKRWPEAGILRDLIPFARQQGSDDLACFEFSSGRLIRICHVHYNLGRRIYVEIHEEFPTIWEWLRAAIEDVKLSFELSQRGDS